MPSGLMCSVTGPRCGRPSLRRSPCPMHPVSAGRRLAAWLIETTRCTGSADGSAGSCKLVQPCICMGKRMPSDLVCSTGVEAYAVIGSCCDTLHARCTHDLKTGDRLPDAHCPMYPRSAGRLTDCLEHGVQSLLTLTCCKSAQPCICDVHSRRMPSGLMCSIGHAAQSLLMLVESQCRSACAGHLQDCSLRCCGCGWESVFPQCCCAV
jgi:hypothetical protein